MSERITDELREWAHGFNAPWKRNEEMLIAIADRIDAAYQKDMDGLRAQCGDMWQKGYAVCHAELIEGHPVIAADLEKAGWIKLPVDADGEPIHVGDELDYLEALHPDVPVRFKVQDMFYCGNGKWHLRAYSATYDPRKCRHYHAPTVEDVLRGVVELCHNTWKEGSAFEFYDVDDVMKSGNIADFAAKLRLASDADA